MGVTYTGPSLLEDYRTWRRHLPRGNSPERPPFFPGQISLHLNLTRESSRRPSPLPTSRASRSVFFGVRCLDAGTRSTTSVSMYYSLPSSISVIASCTTPVLCGTFMTGVSPPVTSENCKHLWSLRNHPSLMEVIALSGRERSFTLFDDSLRSKNVF